MPRREWTDDERELVEELADAGHSQSSTRYLLRHNHAIVVSRGALAGFVSRQGIEFRGKQPPWTHRRRARHKAAMRAFWQRRRLPHAAD